MHGDIYRGCSKQSVLGSIVSLIAPPVIIRYGAPILPRVVTKNVNVKKDGHPDELGKYANALLPPSLPFLCLRCFRRGWCGAKRLQRHD